MSSSRIALVAADQQVARIHVLHVFAKDDGQAGEVGQGQTTQRSLSHDKRRHGVGRRDGNENADDR